MTTEEITDLVNGMINPKVTDPDDLPGIRPEEITSRMKKFRESYGPTDKRTPEEKAADDQEYYHGLVLAAQELAQAQTPVDKALRDLGKVIDDVLYELEELDNPYIKGYFTEKFNYFTEKFNYFTEEFNNAQARVIVEVGKLQSDLDELFPRLKRHD